MPRRRRPQHPDALLNALLTFLAVIGSWHIDEAPREFYMALMLFLETGVSGVFASLDLFLFFLFWEIELIPMFLLIGIWGGARREYAAWKFLLYTLVGSAFMLGGIFLIYFRQARLGILPVVRAARQSHRGHDSFLRRLRRAAAALFLLLIVAFAVKMPMWPVHTWLPDAHTEAPTAVSVLLAGVLLKMGAYGLIRIGFGFVPQGAQQLAPALGIIAAISVLWGAGASMVQSDMKKMIAYSSVSHMGYVTARRRRQRRQWPPPTQASVRQR